VTEKSAPINCRGIHSKEHSLFGSEAEVQAEQDLCERRYVNDSTKCTELQMCEVENYVVLANLRLKPNFSGDVKICRMKQMVSRVFLNHKKELGSYVYHDTRPQEHTTTHKRNDEKEQRLEQAMAW